MLSKEVYLLIPLFVILTGISSFGQDFINREEAITWIGENLKSNSYVALRYDSDFSEYEYGNDHRYFKLMETDGCILLLERYDEMDGKLIRKAVYELPLDEITPDNIKISKEKYSGNLCLVLHTSSKKKKFKVTKLSGNEFWNKQILKRNSVIIEFNKEARSDNIPIRMQRAFQYACKQCNNTSSIINYIESL